MIHFKDYRPIMYMFNFASYGGVQQASKIAGRRKPSQSPSMRLLGMLHVHDDPDGNRYLTNISTKNYFSSSKLAHNLQNPIFISLEFSLQLSFATLHNCPSCG